MIKKVATFESLNRLSGETNGDWDIEGLQERFKELYDIEIDAEAIRTLSVEGAIEKLYEDLVRIYDEKEALLGSELAIVTGK